MDKKHILIVDDEKDFTEIVGTLLDFHNFGVETVNDPQQVMGALAKDGYDLVVTDLMMPGMDGFQLVEKMRASQATHDIPIIVLSAKTLTDEERKRLLVNDVTFLPKPFEPHGLVEKITQMLA